MTEIACPELKPGWVSPFTAAETRLLYRITNTGPAESRTRIT
jgi:hypothetical protein